jgi:tetratricopeptide (TPR) repeat protein
MLDFVSASENAGGNSLSKPEKVRRQGAISRRQFLQYCQGIPLGLVSPGLILRSSSSSSSQEKSVVGDEFHLHPQYRVPRAGIESVLAKVRAGSDEYVTEKYQDQVSAVLTKWSMQILQSPEATTALEEVLAADFSANSAKTVQSLPLRTDKYLQVWREQFAEVRTIGRAEFVDEWRSSLSHFSKTLTAEFQVTHIRLHSLVSSAAVQSVLLETGVRYELVGSGRDFHREQRLGNCELTWELLPSNELRLQKYKLLDQTRSRAAIPLFVDIADHAFAANRSYASQLLHGTDYWRTVLDGACGIDIYGHNGVSVGDIDGDGFDDLYICQPAGLPNRLFRNRGDGTFEDVTDACGVGVLENTACALFVDMDNDGRQDLIVVRANGPLLFLNTGAGKFRLKPDAFRFANPPQGTFTGAAVADYDRDGWLDIYLCLYSYYQGADQYRYPMPYYDAENGPPNFMMHNNRDGTFRDVTKQSGLDQNNTRFSFCCAWGDDNGDQWPDLYVVNDFGRKNLYRNNGNGTFTDIARQARVEDVGAGMSACWRSFANEAREDLYVADMWTAAGIRVSEQDIFQKDASPDVRALYRRHAIGNCLFRNRGHGSFEDVGKRSGTTMGRWAWSSDSWDFDHDGFADLYVSNGMISGMAKEDLNSFFWRQVVAKSPQKSEPNHEYEQGWNAINELIRSDGTWSGFERNIFYLNNHDGTLSDVSGVVGLDFVEDSRTFALADFDQDGRLEVVLKNRNAPQLRFLKNTMPELGAAIAFRLAGKKSNRDAIGAAVTVRSETGAQIRMVQAGSGFLAQHTKELFFGLGAAKSPVQATVRWPSGETQTLKDLPPNHRFWIEEGSPPVRIEPFRSSSLPSAVASSTTETEMLPAVSETWLLAPVPAPDFSLPTLAGSFETLSAQRGKAVLLYFWSTASATSKKDLEEFEELQAGWAAARFQFLAINADALPEASARESLAAYRHHSFPVLIGSPDTLSIYNLLYRHLFDRHRDLPLPALFLIDQQGKIVKIYQGAVPADHLGTDFHAIPRSDTERLGKALPFPGLTATYEFGRNNLSFGSIFYERGYYEQAEEFFRQALEDDPSSAEAFYGIGSVYLQQQKAAEARENFERAIKLHAAYPGTLPNAWNNLGILAAREGNTDSAIADFEHALEIEPAHSIALLNLGNAYRQKKDWAAAKSTLERALVLNPENPEANYSLGMVYAQLNETDRAHEYLTKAIALRPVYPEALNNLGILYLRTGRTEEAIRSFQESIRLAPAYDQSYLNLARVYEIEGNREKARALLLDLLAQHPGHVQANKALGQLEH